MPISIETSTPESRAAKAASSPARPPLVLVPEVPAQRTPKYRDIKTAADLRRRIRLDSSGYQCLDCGNQYHHVRPLLAETGVPENLVFVTYTAGSGSHLIARYIA